jgi:predicted SprT family Zn-dependent metalloprotease
MSLTSDDEIYDLLNDTYLNIGLNTPLNWKWNGRFRSSLGRANYDLSSVELSSVLWPLVSVPIRRSAVIHEACHIGAFKLYGSSGHGVEWEQLMIDCGEKPQSHHKFGKHLNKIQVYCACKDGCLIGKIRHGKITLGKANYACNSCDHILRLVK